MTKEDFLAIYEVLYIESKEHPDSERFMRYEFYIKNRQTNETQFTHVRANDINLGKERVIEEYCKKN